MPLETPAAPQASLDALGGILVPMAASAGLRRAAPRFAARILASPQDLRTPGLSYRVYVLGANDVARGAALAEARLFAWRHEFTTGDEVVSAEIAIGAEHRFSALNVTPPDRSIERDLRSPALSPSNLGGESYELALLQIPALAVRAIWLRAQGPSGEDIVVPIPPDRPEVQGYQSYAPTEYVDALRPAAQAVLAADAPGKGAS